MSCCKQCPIHSDNFSRTSLESLDFLSQTTTSDGWTVTMATTPTAVQAGDTISGVNIADERFYYYVAAVSGANVDIEYLYGPEGTDPEERSPEDQDIEEFDVKRLASSYATPDATGKPANYLWGVTEDGLVSNSDFRLEVVPMEDKINFIADFTWQNDTTNKEFVLWTEAGQNAANEDAGNKVVFWDAGCSTCDGSRNERYRMFIAGSYPSAEEWTRATPVLKSGAIDTTFSSAPTYRVTLNQLAFPGSSNNAIPGWTWAFQEDGVGGETASIFYYRVVEGNAEDTGGWTDPRTGGDGIAVLEYLYDTENVGPRNPYGIEDDLGDQAQPTVYPWREYSWNKPELAGTVRGKLADSTGLVQLQVCQKEWSTTAQRVTIIASSGTNPELPIAMASASAFGAGYPWSWIGGTDRGLGRKVMLSATKGKLIKSLKFEYNNRESGQEDCRPCISLTCREQSTDLMFADSSTRSKWDTDIHYSPGSRFGIGWSSGSSLSGWAAGFHATVDRTAKTLTLAGPSDYVSIGDEEIGWLFDLYGVLFIGRQPSANSMGAKGQSTVIQRRNPFTLEESGGGYGTYYIIELTMTHRLILYAKGYIRIQCGDATGTDSSINYDYYADYPIKAGDLYRVTVCEMPIHTLDRDGNDVAAWSAEWRLESLTAGWEYGEKVQHE